MNFTNTASQGGKNKAENKSSTRNSGPKKAPRNSRYVSSATEKEELAVALHDRVGQPLTALKFYISRASVAPEEERITLLKESVALVNETLSEVRKLLVSLGR
jgi:signal transduction histidine kinase